MQKGFSHEVAPDLIRENPGKTAEELAEMALKRHLCGSDSKTPIRSLAATLEKEVREGRLPEIVRRKEGGQYRYYPAIGSVPKTYSGQREQMPSAYQETYETIPNRVPVSDLELADLLTEIGKSSSRGEALLWLIREGVRQNGDLIQSAKKAAQEIRTIRQSFRAAI